MCTNDQPRQDVQISILPPPLDGRGNGAIKFDIPEKKKNPQVFVLVLNRLPTLVLIVNATATKIFQQLTGRDLVSSYVFAKLIIHSINKTVFP